MRRTLHSWIRSRGPLTLAAILAVVSPLAAESVAIQVETQKGKPIEGAVVSVRDNESGTVLDRAVSSDEGVAVIQQLTPGEWYFEIDRSGYMLYTAYVQVRAGKKPELGFASQVSRGDDWEPMRVKFTKASDKLMRKAVITASPEPRVREPIRAEPRPAAPQPQPTTEPAPVEDTRPEQRPAPEEVTRIEPPQPAAGTVAVPSSVEEVEAESVPTEQEAPPELTLADGDPEPLEDASPTEPQPSDFEGVEAPTPDAPTEEGADDPAGIETAEQTDAATSIEANQQAAEPSQPAAEPESAEPEPASPESAQVPAATTPEQAVDQAVEPALEPELVQPTAPSEPTKVPEDTGVKNAPAEVVPGPSGEPQAPSVETPTPDVEAHEPAAPTPTPSGPPPASRSLRSAAGGTCPECAAGEWAVSAEVQAATAGDTRATSTCADDLDERLRSFVEQLAARSQEPFAGGLTAALWRTAEDAERARMAETAASLNRPQGFCQVAGVVLPPASTMTGYVLEAWDELGGRACNAEGICALGKAAWAGAPVIVSGEHATVVYAVFRNRSTRHERSAELTVLFTPPPEWQ